MIPKRSVTVAAIALGMMRLGNGRAGKSIAFNHPKPRKEYVTIKGKARYLVAPCPLDCGKQRIWRIVGRFSKGYRNSWIDYQHIINRI